MRILLINSEFPPVGGGAGNASAYLGRALVRAGHTVSVVTSRWGDLPIEELVDGVRVYRIRAMRRRTDRSGALEQLVFILASFFWSLGHVRRERPNVILAFFGAPSGVAALGLHWLFGLPFIVSLRGGDVPGFRPYDFALFHKLIGPLLHVVWRQAAAVVANSEGLCALAEAFDAHVDISIVPNGVAVEDFPAATRQWEPARLLIAGRVVYQKGIDLLLQALAGLKDLPWELDVAGDGPLLAELEILAEQLSLTDRVNFLGWQEKPALAECYRSANLYVYPSRHEGMPNVVLEAMASGLPVIASRIAGNEELVLPGETGLLVPPEDVDALRDAVRELLPDAERRASMGARARKRVEEKYTWAGAARQYSEIFQAAWENS
ncbi:MAG: glycosyltransferase family 4 protein [Anaerolineae bacterium]|nr:glycosyltransferase family 4 protein [Anaerolineae bacterium]